jgi:hypothetical protein
MSDVSEKGYVCNGLTSKDWHLTTEKDAAVIGAAFNLHQRSALQLKALRTFYQQLPYFACYSSHFFGSIDIE